jgi:hypothetical protein
MRVRSTPGISNRIRMILPHVASGVGLKWNLTFVSDGPALLVSIATASTGKCMHAFSTIKTTHTHHAYHTASGLLKMTSLVCDENHLPALQNQKGGVAGHPILPLDGSCQFPHNSFEFSS